MSGGVDSTLAAALMLEAGCRVMGVTMALTVDDQAVSSARAMAEHLGIEHHWFELGDTFERLVLRPCWEAYARGRTPNPCVLCNRWMKFGVVLERARELGASRLVTGHHARLRRRSGGRVTLVRGADAVKDQSYFLARLDSRQLAAAGFPIGAWTKEQVRAEAWARGLPCAGSAESQDTCVAATAGGREGGFAEALRARFAEPAPTGELVDTRGRALGGHGGIHRFTIGQRRGLGVALGRRAYVAGIDGRRRRVTLTTDAAELEVRGLRADDERWHVRPEPLIGAARRCEVQVRSRHGAVAGEVARVDERSFLVDFHHPVAAVTPGQLAVLYDGDEVIGSGWIAAAMTNTELPPSTR
jgi:tRNA-specific 2-thiouridylase